MDILFLFMHIVLESSQAVLQYNTGCNARDNLLIVLRYELAGALCGIRFQGFLSNLAICLIQCLVGQLRLWATLLSSTGHTDGSDRPGILTAAQDSGGGDADA